MGRIIWCVPLSIMARPNMFVGNYAFSNCSRLKSIKVLATTPPTADNSSFSGVKSATLYVPEEAVDIYKSTAPWSKFSTIIGF